LPKGYQISQYDLPLVEKGYLMINNRKIQITRIHLEEDTGKLIHPKGENYSLVDYNRAGVPLMELVTEPDIRSGVEARASGQELQLILRTLNISRADMEKGEMRVEVNISLRKVGEEKFGTKVEIKNLNSFRAVEKSIEYEFERQTEILEEGGKIVQETRGWNEDKAITFSQRAKETAMDYRYFPEPDLPPVVIDEQWLKQISNSLPELPEEKRGKYKELGLTEEIVEVLVNQIELGQYFERVVKLSKVEAKLIANWLVHESVDLRIKEQDFAEFISMIVNKEISGTMGKEVLKLMNETCKSPKEIVEEKGLKQITGEDALGEIIKKIVADNPKAVEDFKAGKQAAIGFLMGMVMKETKGQAEPATTQKMLREELSK
jgi:aspartyl-tRNA(Asn)/glutamyl-tRNA(Gln) amidotransferase subunit B